MNSATFSTPTMANDPVSMPWSIPAIVKNADKGLEDVSLDTLQKTLQPVLEGLRSLKADDILDLERVPEGGGAEISSTYVVCVHSTCAVLSMRLR